MINAEVNDWSVTFYGESGNEVDRATLRAILDAGRKRQITAGSVGVVDIPTDLEVVVHVDMSHCDASRAKEVLRDAGIDPETITFRYVRIEWENDTSRRNRKRRLAHAVA